MGSFKRALLGYRRDEVDLAIAARDAQIDHLGQRLQLVPDLERELDSLSAMVIEREREMNDLREQLREANGRADRSIASLDAVTARLEEIQAQARGQATRIRMKALREAVEVSQRVQDLVGLAGNGNGAGGGAEAAANGNGHSDVPAEQIFEGLVRVEVGPLGDFSQLVGFEDAAAQIDASEGISVERFSEGRATLAITLAEPVALLRELESRAPVGFHIRETGPERVVLDVDADAVRRAA
jgi:hypothetical protein